MDATIADFMEAESTTTGDTAVEATATGENSGEECYLLLLPPETLLEILVYAGPIASTRLGATSKFFHTFVGSPALQKALFLSLFDPPPAELLYIFDYRSVLQARSRATTWLATKSSIALLRRADHAEDYDLTLDALADVAATRAPLPARSLNQAWLDLHFPEALSYFFDAPASSPHLHSLRDRHLLRAPRHPSLSHLHLLHTPTPASTHTLVSRTRAREIVYDQANFGRGSLWGPFASRTARVDWNKLEALAIVMRANMEEVQEAWGPRPPRSWESTRSGPLPSDSDAGHVERDWAGVESQAFTGTYCFLDYRIFEHFNFHRSRNYRPTLDDETEAVGECMRITLQLLPESTPPSVDGPSPPSSRSSSDNESDSDSEPMLRDSEPMLRRRPRATRPRKAPAPAVPPRLSFTGSSKPLHFTGLFSSPSPIPKRSLAGTVEMTPDGNVHWSYTISYGGGPQWLMHGVQIGGVRSKYGIVGTWSTADHDESGPNGPFWYWPEQEAVIV